jgi:SAM-dependent methyltransferase
VDISPTGIKRAQAACAERGITFDAQVSDVTRLPWQDATFDAAFSIATIHHHLRADIQKAVDEVRRVLKPGGIFLVDLLCVGTIPYNRSRQQVTTGESVEVEPNTFVDERPDSEDSDGFLPHHYFDEADARDLLRDFEIMRFMSGADDIVLENGERRSSGKWVVWARKPQQA